MPSAHPLIDHDDIRTWAEERGAHPACVRRTGGKGDPGMIRLDFPGFGGRRSLAPITWNQWFTSFDDNNLALLVQDRTARGQRSNFNKLVSRESITEGLPPRRRRKAAGRSRTAASRKSTSARSAAPRRRTKTTRPRTASRSRSAASSGRTKRSSRSTSARSSSRSRSSSRRASARARH